MNWIVISGWIRTYDPDNRLLYVQRLMVESALMRDDVKTAKKYINDFLGKQP